MTKARDLSDVINDIDGIVIGGTTPAAGSFTTFTSTGIDASAAVSTAITIDASGNVGIGGAPAEKFNVRNSGLALIRVTSTDNGGSGIYFANTGSSDRRLINESAAFKFQDFDGTNTYATIDASGNATFTGEITQLAAGGGTSALNLYEDGVGDIGVRLQYDGSTNVFGVLAGNNPVSKVALYIDRDTARVQFGEGDTGIGTNVHTITSIEGRAVAASDLVSTLRFNTVTNAPAEFEGAFIRTEATGSRANTNLVFGVSQAANTNATEFMRADAGGNVTVSTGDLTIVSGDLNVNNGKFLLGAGTELTIASGAITVTAGYHVVDTEGDAASDSLTTISGGINTEILVLRAANDARSISVEEGGNIILNTAGTFVMDNTDDTLMLMYDGATGRWRELSRSDNSA